MEGRLGMVGDRPSRARKLVLRSNGIQSRYYVIDPHSGQPTMNNAQLTAEAVRGLVGEGFELQKLQGLVASSSSPDQTMPNHAGMVHGPLARPAGEAVAASGICLCGDPARKDAWMRVACGR